MFVLINEKAHWKDEPCNVPQKAINSKFAELVMKGSLLLKGICESFPTSVFCISIFRTISETLQISKSVLYWVFASFNSKQESNLQQ